MPPGSTPYLDDTANTWKGALQGVGGVGGGVLGAVFGGPAGAYFGANLGSKLGGAAGTSIDGADANYKVAQLHPDWVLGANGQLGPRTNVAPVGGSTVPVAGPGSGAGGAPAGGVGSMSSPLTGTPGGASGITPEINNMLTTYKSRSAPGIAPVTVGQGQQATAGTAYAPTLGPAAQATSGMTTAPTVGPAALATADHATASLANGATIDQTQSNQTRGQQQQSLSDLFAASRGLTPSVAELQLRSTTDRNVANQLALASALQGRSVGGALKQASDASGQINAQAASDAAVLRAQEQAQARNQLSTALQGVRTSDIGVATSQGELQNAANLENANNLTSTSGTNATLGTNVSTSNANQRNLLTGKQADLASIAGITNANNVTNTNQYNAGQTNDVSKFGAGLAKDVSVANANNTTSASQTNANNSTTLVGKQADISQQTAVDNVANQLKVMGYDDAQIKSYLDAMVTSKGQDITGANNARANDITSQNNLADQAIRQAAAAWQQKKDVATLAGSGLAALGASDVFKTWWNQKYGATPVSPKIAVSDPASPGYNPRDPNYSPTADSSSPAYDPTTETTGPTGDQLPTPDDTSTTGGSEIPLPDDTPTG